MFSDRFGSIFINMKIESKDRGVAQSKPFVPIKTKPHKAKVETSMGFKGKSDSQPKST